MRTVEAIVEPKLLKWARESIALDISRVSKGTSFPEQLIRQWESGEKKPTISQLEKLADRYKRPLAVFFLSNPPEEPPLPDDFRALPEGVTPFSSKTLLEIRRVRNIQSLYLELSESFNLTIHPNINRTNLRSNPDKLADNVRIQLDVNINDQLKWQNEYYALNNWKKLVERQGILALEVNFPIEEGRAFSIADDKVPVIVLNSKDSTNGKIFSLFHEYAHILLNRGGICDMSNKMESISIERFCNRFSGSLLVPRNYLLGIINNIDINTNINYHLIELAKTFKVSRQVILRRFLILDIISTELYNYYQKELKREYKEKQRKRGGRSIPSLQCIRRNGFNFVSLVLASFKSGNITYSDISDYLGIKINHLPALEGRLQEMV